MRNLPVLLLCLFTCLFISCQSDKTTETTTLTDNTTTADPPEATADPQVASQNVEAGDEDYLLSESGTSLVQLGQSVEAAGYSLKKGRLSTGEGKFQIFYIRDRDSTMIGYTLPEDGKVGPITITSPKFHDPNGIRVGSTFGQLRAAYPSIQANGSEIEGRVYAKQGAFSYRLNTTNNQYELEEDAIPESVVIREIVIR